MRGNQTFIVINQAEWYRPFGTMVLHAGLIH